MPRERSAGGVVYSVRDGEVLVLMILDRFGRWSLPKGLIDPGESEAAAALREVREETGVEGTVEARLGETSYYYFDADRGRIAKRVVYFLVRAQSSEPVPQKGEVAEVAWVPAGEVLERAAYANLRPVLEEALRRLGVAG
ncbi:MAG: NUDIX hydrolase [Acetobacteraceae bacterium]|nr:NUDIX hydrolase [Acetobacteraceae bacterium]